MLRFPLRIWFRGVFWVQLRCTHFSAPLSQPECRWIRWTQILFSAQFPTEVTPVGASCQVTQVERSFMDEIANLGETCVPLKSEKPEKWPKKSWTRPQVASKKLSPKECPSKVRFLKKGVCKPSMLERLATMALFGGDERAHCPKTTLQGQRKKHTSTDSIVTESETLARETLTACEISKKVRSQSTSQWYCFFLCHANILNLPFCSPSSVLDACILLLLLLICSYSNSDCSSWVSINLRWIHMFLSPRSVLFQALTTTTQTRPTFNHHEPTVDPNHCYQPV